MNRQIVGFILGTVFLVIVIIIGARFMSYAVDISVKMNNMNTLNWLSNGLSQAIKGGWDAGDDYKKLESTNQKHYAILVIDKKTHDYIVNNANFNKCGESDYNCYSASTDFDMCGIVKSYCLCLVSSNKGLFSNDVYSTTDCGSNEQSAVEHAINDTVLNKIKSGVRLDIIECKSMDMAGLKEYIPIEDTSRKCIYSFNTGSYKFKVNLVSKNNEVYFNLSKE